MLAIDDRREVAWSEAVSEFPVRSPGEVFKKPNKQIDSLQTHIKQDQTAQISRNQASKNEFLDVHTSRSHNAPLSSSRSGAGGPQVVTTQSFNFENVNESEGSSKAAKNILKVITPRL